MKFMSKLYKKLKGLFFSDVQKMILKECKLSNNEQYSLWIWRNALWPICIILIPLLIALVFKTSICDFKSLIFNGSLSLLGINILFGMSSYLIPLQKMKNKKTSQIKQDEEYQEIDNIKLNSDVYHLRERLDTFKNILVAIGAIFYIIAKVFNSYNSDLWLYIFNLLTIIVLIISITIGRYIFVIKDDFFENTYYSIVNNPVIENRNRWDSKY